MKLIIALLLALGLGGVVYYFLNKNRLFITPTKAIYYKANPKKAPNYIKPKYPNVVPNYYKANPRNAPNYVNPTSKATATMEVDQSGFKQ